MIISSEQSKHLDRPVPNSVNTISGSQGGNNQDSTESHGKVKPCFPSYEQGELSMAVPDRLLGLKPVFCPFNTTFQTLLWSCCCVSYFLSSDFFPWKDTVVDSAALFPAMLDGEGTKSSYHHRLPWPFLQVSSLQLTLRQTALQSYPVSILGHLKPLTD